VRTVRLLVLGFCSLLAGCSLIGLFVPEGPPSNEQILALYRQTILKQTTSADVLTMFGNPDYALLSQSKSIIAFTGTTKQKHKLWLNMVTFDENELKAKRKYFLISNERPKQLFVTPWEGVDFGCQMVLSQDILNEPYANENARRIAILKQVEADTRKDTGEVGTDNASISLCGMMAGQGMKTLLTKFDSSPAFAANLSEPNGVKFEHPSFDKGEVRMVIVNDIVTVRMHLGSFAKGKLSFEKISTLED